ncbi:MAG: hypothetical protein ACHP7J_02600 [Terriglobales bacterium]
MKMARFWTDGVLLMNVLLALALVLAVAFYLRFAIAMHKELKRLRSPRILYDRNAAGVLASIGVHRIPLVTQIRFEPKKRVAH